MAQTRAKESIQALGCGYDVLDDLRLNRYKRDSKYRLIELDESQTQDLVIQGGITIPGVPKAIACEKGERTRFRTDVLPFQQMSEQVNQWMSIPGKIPLGLFNGMFGFSGHWQKDALSVKNLAIDGWLITFYSVELPKSQLVLREEVKKEVPSSWDPQGLASFIEKYGTHIIIGVKIGGKDVLCMKQHQSSPLSTIEIQALLKKKADERFANTEYGDDALSTEQIFDGEKNSVMNQSNQFQLYNTTTVLHSSQDNATILCSRRGGNDTGQSHNQWLQTVPGSPDVVLMSFVPITSLLNGVAGSGFLSHAINLYLRHKPPIEELMHFLEFQLPRQWAPAFSDLPLGPPKKGQSTSLLRFSLIGPRLYVNTTPVSVGRRPVTGLRLYLEGRRCNRLAIHVQHVSSVPRVLQPFWEDNLFAGEPKWQGPEDPDERYSEPVFWKSFSHVCTAPVENADVWGEESASGAHVVIGARLIVKKGGPLRRILYLDLLYSKIPQAKIRRSEWDHTPAASQKSGFFSTLMSGNFSNVLTPPPTKPSPPNLNSGIYPEGPPVPVRRPKLLKFVDTTEYTKGPQDMPGHWLVTGAKLYLDRGKISLRVKYSLLIC